MSPCPLLPSSSALPVPHPSPPAPSPPAPALFIPNPSFAPGIPSQGRSRSRSAGSARAGLGEGFGVKNDPFPAGTRRPQCPALPCPLLGAPPVPAPQIHPGNPKTAAGTRPRLVPLPRPLMQSGDTERDTRRLRGQHGDSTGPFPRARMEGGLWGQRQPRLLSPSPEMSLRRVTAPGRLLPQQQLESIGAGGCGGVAAQPGPPNPPLVLPGPARGHRGTFADRHHETRLVREVPDHLRGTAGKSGGLRGARGRGLGWSCSSTGDPEGLRALSLPSPDVPASSPRR